MDQYVNEREGQEGVDITGDDDQVVLDATGASRAAHTTVRFPFVEMGDFDDAAKAMLHLDFVAIAEGVPGTEPTRASAYTIFVRQFDQHDQPVPSEPDRVRFFAGPSNRRIVLPFACDPATTRLELVLYQARDQAERLIVRRLRYVFGRFSYRRDGHALSREADVTATGTWSQHERRVQFECYWGRFWADMPAGWRLDDVHPNCLIGAEYLLTHNVNRRFLTVQEGSRRFYDPDFGPPRSQGDSILLAFSAGQDSTAAACLLPEDAIKVHLRRAYDGYFTHNGAYVRLRAFDAEARALESFHPLALIPNTFELIGVAAGTRFGFRDHFGYGAVLLLLADHFGAGYVASGAPMEHVFLGSGNRYVDVVGLPASQHNTLSRFFLQCGVNLTLPVGYISEVLTNAIVNASRYRGVAVSCPNVDRAGAWCGSCFKCFRKLRLDGSPAPPPSQSVRRALAARPLKNATSVLYALQQSGERLDEVAEYQDVDLSFLGRYHVAGLDGLLRGEIREHVARKLASFGIGPMSAADEDRLRRIGQIFTPDAFDPAVAGLPSG